MEKCNHDVLEVRIDNIEKDVEELKDYKKIMMENTAQLKENLVRLTVLLEKQDERLQRQDSKIEKHQDETMKEVKSIRTEIHRANELHTNWYQKFFEDNFGKTTKFLFIVILVLLGVKIAGIDISGMLNK